MNKKLLSTVCLITLTMTNSVLAIDMGKIQPVNPLENNSQVYQFNIGLPSYDLKKGMITQNSIKNQYTIAMDKFMQSNVRASYQDFKVLIDSVVPNDYVYMKLSKEMASIGFFTLSELALSKIDNSDIASLIEEDVKNYYFPDYTLTYKDQIYLAEIYSNIMYNDQSREGTSELMKQTSLLADSDYANYIVAVGSLKNGDIQQAEKSIDIAISKNSKNINYKRFKAEVYSQSNKPQDGVRYLNELEKEGINTVVFDDELQSSQQYILYKAAKNEYWKKYHLANYYYQKEDYNKALRVLQTSISGKKNINKEVFALFGKVYFAMKEYEKAQDYAFKTIDIDKNNSSAYMLLGDIAILNNDIKLAESYYKKVSDDRIKQTAQIRLAQIYEKLNNLQKAKEIYSKILRVSSKAYEAYYQMALLDKSREEVYIKKSVAINPNFYDGWIDLARLELDKDDIDKALSYLNIAKYIDENNYRYYYYYGMVMKNKGLIAEANKYFEKSLKLNPNNEDAKKELEI